MEAEALGSVLLDNLILVRDLFLIQPPSAWRSWKGRAEDPETFYALSFLEPPPCTQPSSASLFFNLEASWKWTETQSWTCLTPFDAYDEMSARTAVEINMQGANSQP